MFGMKGKKPMSNVIQFPGETSMDIDPKEMLTNINEQIEFSGLVLVGWAEGEDRLIVCSSMGSVAEIVFALETGKKAIMDAAD
jgi:hypothetical protein